MIVMIWRYLVEGDCSYPGTGRSQTQCQRAPVSVVGFYRHPRRRYPSTRGAYLQARDGDGVAWNK